jgi:hypothetical protein
MLELSSSARSATAAVSETVLVTMREAKTRRPASDSPTSARPDRLASGGPQSRRLILIRVHHWIEGISRSCAGV